MFAARKIVKQLGWFEIDFEIGIAIQFINCNAQEWDLNILKDDWMTIEPFCPLIN
jgi:hypothetical protein